MEIGFIRVGDMGQGIVPRLLAAGHRVTGWNRTASVVPPLPLQPGDGITFELGPLPPITVRV